jgi:hypothetical protein
VDVAYVSIIDPAIDLTAAAVSVFLSLASNQIIQSSLTAAETACISEIPKISAHENSLNVPWYLNHPEFNSLMDQCFGALLELLFLCQQLPRQQ